MKTRTGRRRILRKTAELVQKGVCDLILWTSHKGQQFTKNVWGRRVMSYV